jgi:protein involved in ribonucleotide reduction
MIPKQIIKFLNNPDNRKHIKAVIAGGNTNFGTHFGKAAEIIAAKLDVPILYRFEITGTPEDVVEVKERLAKLWQITHSTVE